MSRRGRWLSAAGLLVSLGCAGLETAESGPRVRAQSAEPAPTAAPRALPAPVTLPGSAETDPPAPAEAALRPTRLEIKARNVPPPIPNPTPAKTPPSTLPPAAPSPAAPAPTPAAPASEPIGSPTPVHPAPPPAAPAAGAPVIPITLEAVLQLAEEQNPQIAVARERVHQANAEQDLAAKKWLPDLHVGAGYYRHEGGIQDQDGRLVISSTGAVIAGLDLAARIDLRGAAFAKLDAARKSWQQRGELRKLSSEVIVEAAGVYIDLLSAHHGLAIIRGQIHELETLRQRAERLANLEKAARVEVARIQADLAGQHQLARKLESQTRAASHRLAYLLGCDPQADLIPVDMQLAAYALVDADQPAPELVARALAHGPGVKELESVLAAIQTTMSEASGPNRYLPVFTAQALEGGFGAGPNSNLTFVNRFDVGLQARWNLTEMLTGDAQRRIGCSALAQARLTYQDLRAKLTFGVQEAREAILAGRDQLQLAMAQIQQAQSALELSDLRLREGIPGSSYSEVLLAQRGVALAQANYLAILRDYDKAQIRLLVLTGCHCPVGPAAKQ